MHLKLDYSAISTFRTCPLKFYHRYVRGLVAATATNEAQTFGKLFHQGLETLYRAGFPSAEAAEIFITNLDTEGLSQEPNARRGAEHLRTLLRKYVENYYPEVIALRAFEQFLEVPINDWLTYCGTLDGITQDGSVFETKTSSFLGSSFLDRMKPNDQATGYLYLLKKTSNGKNTSDRIIFNGASTSGYGLKSKPTSWPLWAKPAEHFIRCETFRTDEDMETWERRLLADAERIRECIESELYSCNPPDSCTMFNSVCPYIDICRSRNANKETLIKTAFKLEPWKGCVIS